MTISRTGFGGAPATARVVALVLAWLAASGPARAGAAEPPAVEAPAPATPAGEAPTTGGIPELTDVTPGSVALTAGGFVSAFLVHEACHVVANLAMANVPSVQPVRFAGFLPFFAVSPDIQCRNGSCTKRNGAPFVPGPTGYAFIVSSGILCQEITDEIILTEHPRIRSEREPFLKGMLLFNTATSVAYAVANLTGIEPPEGDLAGLDHLGGLPRGVMAGVVLATAALDVARYFLPDATWLPWVSRGSKVVTVGLVLSY